jgi:glycosyltransferase involved in cell wall biosynthesis
MYNDVLYITRCFNSISKQSYQNIECIFVNDCSHDNSVQVLQELIKGYAGSIVFQIISNVKNSGTSESRNVGIKNAKGDYIYFMDHDDELTENCITFLVRLAEKYTDVDIVQGNQSVYPPSTDTSDPYDLSTLGFPEYSNNRIWLKQHFFITPRFPVPPWNKLVRRNFILENNLYFKKDCAAPGEDLLWEFFVAKKITSMAFTNEFCYVYHWAITTSVTHSAKSSQKRNKLSPIEIVLNEMIANIDLEIAEVQKKWIIDRLRYDRFRPNQPNTVDLTHDRYYVKILRQDALKSRHLFRFLGLSLLLLPYRFYNTGFIRKLSGLFIRLSFLSSR